MPVGPPAVEQPVEEERVSGEWPRREEPQKVDASAHPPAMLRHGAVVEENRRGWRLHRRGFRSCDGYQARGCCDSATCDSDLDLRGDGGHLVPDPSSRTIARFADYYAEVEISSKTSMSCETFVGVS